MRRPRSPLPSLNDETIVRNSLYNLLGTGLPVLLAVAAVPVAIRLMGLERFALLSLLWAALRMATIPCSGYASALLRNVAHELGGQAREQRVAAIIRASFLLQLAVSLLAGALLWAAAPWLGGTVLKFRGDLGAEAVLAFRSAAVILPFYSAAYLFSSALAAYQRFAALNLAKLVFESGCICLPPAVFAAGWGLRELAAALLAWEALAAAVYLILLRARGLLRGVFAPAAPLASELSGYAGLVTLARAAIMGGEETARFVTGAVCGAAALSLYNVPHEIYTALAMLPLAFITALFPAFTSACAREDRARLNAYFYAYSAKLLLLTSLAFSGLIVFAPEILLLVTGTEQPAAAVLTLQLFGLAEMAAGTNYVAASWFNGLNLPRTPVLTHGLSLALFLPACWGAVTLFGIPGAAGAVLLKVLLENALYLRAAERTGARAGRAVFAGAAAGALALAACGWALSRSLPSASPYKTLFFLGALAVAGALVARGQRGAAAPAEKGVPCGAKAA